jgi:hypothetical protein
MVSNPAGPLDTALVKQKRPAKESGGICAVARVPLAISRATLIRKRKLSHEGLTALNLLETMKLRLLRNATHVLEERSVICGTDNSAGAQAGDAAITSPRRRSLISKPVREIAVDLTFFVMGVVILYGVDLTVLSRGAPIAIQYLVQFCLYLNHHAVAAVETLY